MSTTEANKRIAHQPSMLDLIDDTTLTSLPLPPPLKSRGRNSTQSSLASLDLKPVLSPDSEREYTICEAQSETSDSEDEETDTDPIVLIEDYMNRDKPMINRKASLATFKKRMQTEVSSISESTINSELEPTIGSKRSISNDMGQRKRTENLKELFGSLPGADTLKYCDLCEKPLYEISSIINNHKKLKASRIASYSEFVCWECVDVYEEFLTEFETEMEQNKSKQHDTNERLLDIFQRIEYKYEHPRQLWNHTPKRAKSSFSQSLIGRLASLKEERKDLDWFRKLQWNWKGNES